MLQKPQVRSDLTIVELDGEAVIYDDDAGELHHLNGTATLVFSLLDGTATIAQLVQELAEVYGVPSHEISPQVEDIVARFGEAGLFKSDEVTRG